MAPEEAVDLRHAVVKGLVSVSIRSYASKDDFESVAAIVKMTSLQPSFMVDDHDLIGVLQFLHRAKY